MNDKSEKLSISSMTVKSNLRRRDPSKDRWGRGVFSISTSAGDAKVYCDFGGMVMVVASGKPTNSEDEIKQLVDKHLDGVEVQWMAQEGTHGWVASSEFPGHYSMMGYKIQKRKSW